MNVIVYLGYITDKDRLYNDLEIIQVIIQVSMINGKFASY